MLLCAVEILQGRLFIWMGGFHNMLCNKNPTLFAESLLLNCLENLGSLYQSRWCSIKSIAPTIVTICGNELTLVGMGGESMVAVWRGSLLQCGVWRVSGRHRLSTQGKDFGMT